MDGVEGCMLYAEGYRPSVYVYSSEKKAQEHTDSHGEVLCLLRQDDGHFPLLARLVAPNADNVHFPPRFDSNQTLHNDSSVGHFSNIDAIPKHV